MSSIGAFLSGFPTWGPAIDRLRDLHDRHGAEALQQADSYTARYEKRRAAMVYDVVYSRQRKYEARVMPRVAEFEAEEAAATSLAALAEFGPRPTGLRAGEPVTMQKAAGGLLRFGAKHELSDDDSICLGWAEAAAVVGVAHRLDPYVGSVEGIGLALFGYMRMRSGAATRSSPTSVCAGASGRWDSRFLLATWRWLRWLRRPRRNSESQSSSSINSFGGRPTAPDGHRRVTS